MHKSYNWYCLYCKKNVEFWVPSVMYIYMEHFKIADSPQHTGES